MAPDKVDWLHKPCRLRRPQRFKDENKQNHQWTTNGWIGYITSPVLEVPKASKRGKKSEVAHKWVDGLHNPYRLGGPQHFKEEDQTGSGPQIGGLAT